MCFDVRSDAEGLAQTCTLNFLKTHIRPGAICIFALFICQGSPPLMCPANHKPGWRCWRDAAGGAGAAREGDKEKVLTDQFKDADPGA